MKITITKGTAGLGFAYHAGDEAEFDDKIAKELIEAGYAEDASPAEETAPAEEAAEDEKPAEAKPEKEAAYDKSHGLKGKK